MIVLLPTSDIQTISIIPRTVSFYFASDYRTRVESDNGILESLLCVNSVLEIVDDLSITITRDGNGDSETITDATVLGNGNFTDIAFSSTILSDGDYYFLELTKAGNLMYRDKVYATSQTDFTVKHKQAQNNYTQYNTIDDNTYIV